MIMTEMTVELKVMNFLLPFLELSNQGFFSSFGIILLKQWWKKTTERCTKILVHCLGFPIYNQNSLFPIFETSQLILQSALIYLALSL